MSSRKANIKRNSWSIYILENINAYECNVHYGSYGKFGSWNIRDGQDSSFAGYPAILKTEY